MKNDYPLLWMRPKTYMIGRETPAITIEIFRMCIERRAKQERNKARWERFVQFIKMPKILKLCRMNSFEVHTVDN
jgi:hypothetical protein